MRARLSRRPVLRTLFRVLVLLGPASVAGADPAPRADAALGDAAHHALLAGSRFPTAAECGSCHPRHYREWSVSQHAYAQLSPVFNAMQATVTRLTNGTNGDFCIRCHTAAGMALGEPAVASNLDRAPVSLEGITCVTCHRQNANYGKFSGRVPIVEGDVHATVYGPTGGAELERVLADEAFRLVAEPGQGPGRAVHAGAERFFEMTTPAFCGTCHDVTLVDGFRLEEAFSEYKISPSARAGETCQDCHMSRVPGDPSSGYEEGPAAVVGGRPTRPRKLTNHMIVGPDHSVIHPAVFPHDPRAQDLATIAEWLDFDWEEGWGTDSFEGSVAPDASFPDRWDSVDDRYEAREIVEQHLELLEEARDRGTELLRRGYRLGDVVVEREDRRGLRFRVEVRSGITSHNVPTGFVGERLVFLRVRVTDADGREVFVSGDLDPNGDVRDLHSAYVNAGLVPLDRQLFSLQSRFLTENLRGGEREQVLPVNHSVDALPFVRPETVPSTLTGRPRGARIHKVGIPPGESRWAEYRVRGRELTGRAPYQVDIELVAGMVPVNLIHAIQDAGFDYGMTAREVADEIVAGHRVLWSKSLALDGVPGG